MLDRHPLLLLAGLLGAGCNLFATQECLTDPEEYARDPATAECITVSNQDGCQYCFRSCVVGDLADLNYAACDDACASATEAECLARPACRAAYTDAAYFACLPTAPRGLVHSGRCESLNAYQCSLHDNCTVHFASHTDGTRSFDHCADENP
jgi:hypothetical protein